MNTYAQVKLHVVAILDYNIILAAKITGQRTGDSPTLRCMLPSICGRRFSTFNADKAYDSDKNCISYTRKE